MFLVLAAKLGPKVVYQNTPEAKGHIMHKNQEDKSKMPFFDAFKTAAAIGLLMQHSTALYCQEANQFATLPYSYHRGVNHSRGDSGLMMEEALGVIKELTSVLNDAYSLLLKSTESNRDSVIRRLDPIKTDLVELQLRWLEGAIKNVYRECPEEKRHIVKIPLLVTAHARSSAANLNHLIAQMTKPAETFVSEIDMDALRVLAKHGTNVFESGRFH